MPYATPIAIVAGRAVRYHLPWKKKREFSLPSLMQTA